jgi:hypothetical protein
MSPPPPAAAVECPSDRDVRGKFFVKFCDLSSEQLHEAKQDVVRHFEPECFENLDEIIDIMDNMDSQPLRLRGSFKWGNYWKKKSGCFVDLGTHVRSAMQIYKSRSAGHAGELECFFPHEFTMALAESVLCTISQKRLWQRDALMESISKDLGIPLFAGHRKQVQLILDQAILTYQKTYEPPWF